MKFGVFHLLWAMPRSDMPLHFDTAAARQALAAEGLEGTLTTSLSADRDITADDPATRRTGRDFLKVYVDHAAFNPDIPELANFIKLWRRVERDQDTLAREGLRFLR